MLTKQQIEWCNKYIVQNWTINSRSEVAVKHNLFINTGRFERFPVQFADVKGEFSCSSCYNLKTLEGSPRNVVGRFSCKGCLSLETFKGSPRNINDNFFYPIKILRVSTAEQEIFNNKVLFKLWINSDLELDDFLLKHHGSITGNKFGI